MSTCFPSPFFIYARLPIPILEPCFFFFKGQVLSGEETIYTLLRYPNFDCPIVSLPTILLFPLRSCLFLVRLPQQKSRKALFVNSFPSAWAVSLTFMEGSCFLFGVLCLRPSFLHFFGSYAYPPLPWPPPCGVLNRPVKHQAPSPPPPQLGLSPTILCSLRIAGPS